MRRDIQFLRGIAVLVVVLYHSNLGILNQGYLGVDVFFVLSGFLITGIVLKALENNQFSFSEFYLRRAKRLLPALYSTLFFTTLLSLIALTHQQWIEYLQQLIGALTFTANMVLPSQTGYFESASEGKPLLHIWSLSLEEQYYFLLPITLYLLPKKLRIYGILFLILASLYWCFSWVYNEDQYAPFLWRLADSTKSEWAFYLLFTRAWELLIGSLCAWIMLKKPTIAVPKWLKCTSLVLIFFSCTVNINNEHPSIESLIIVLATMVILLGNKEWLPKNIVTRIIEKTGDWSYSIYLVHWPLFAFAYLSYLGEVPTTVKFTLIVCSIILGYMQFKFIETPFRIGVFKNLFSSWKVTIAATSILLVIPITSAYNLIDSEDEYAHKRRINYGLGVKCDGSFDENGNLKNACLSANAPKIVVWGDSYAMHLIPGLLVKNNNIAQITKSVCGPIKGVAPVTGKYDSVWAKSCLDFNELALEYIKNTQGITHVVLSANFSNYLEFDQFSYLTFQGLTMGDYQSFINAFQNTILEIKKLGITPVVFTPLPQTGFNVGECLERMFGSTLLLRESCNINYDKAQQYQNLVNTSLKEIESITEVVWLRDYLCKDIECKVEIDGTFIYRDEGHIAVDGSVELLKHIKINGFINPP